jgi:hypothetical protein
VSRLSVSLELYTPSGNRRAFAFPAHYEVCWRCDGTGSHVNPSIDGNGISAEQFAEDPEFKEAYFSGAYDVACYECRGARVLPEVVEDGLRGIKLARYRLYLRQQDEFAATEREHAAERRMGA